MRCLQLEFCHASEAGVPNMVQQESEGGENWIFPVSITCALGNPELLLLSLRRFLLHQEQHPLA